MDLHIPKSLGYYTRDDQERWNRTRNKWPITALQEPTDLLESELIMPLPKTMRQSLIQHFYALHGRVAALQDPRNRDCLVRVYLGVRRENRGFRSDLTLRNFEVDLNIIDELHLKRVHHARAMAVCLSEMHWRGDIDAADVEFVLGTAREELAPKAVEIKSLPPRTISAATLNFKRRFVHLWLLDFNQCKSITTNEAGVRQATAAF